MGDETLVAQVLADAQSALLDEPTKALFAFVDRVNSDSPATGPDDIAGLHGHGWTDEAIYDAITVCALFNFFNRWIDSTGVHPMSDREHRAAAKRMAAGYIRSATAQR